MSSQIIQPRGSSSNIFINYRRTDSSGHAGRLYDALNAHFPGRVFMDIDTLEPGVDFIDVIEQAVGSCEVLIVLIGREWLNVKNGAGHRRLDDPADFVRLELESALTRSIRIIPVLVQDAVMPSSEELPPSLTRLARRNAIEISDVRWAYDVERLVHTIQEILAKTEGLAPEEAVPDTPRAAGSRPWLLPLAAGLLVAVLALSAVLWLRRTPSGSDPVPAQQARLDEGSVAKTAKTVTPAPIQPAVDPPRLSEPTPAAPTPSVTPPVAKPHRETPAVRPISKPSAPTLPVQVHVDQEKPVEPQPEKPVSVAPVLPPRVTITDPAAGAEVDSTVQVKGTIANLGEQRAFLCIRQGNGKIYPRGEVFPEGGKWSIQLRSSKEKTFDILIVTTSNKEGAQALSDQKYRDNGMAALPDGAFISSGSVAVKRMGKIRGIFNRG